MSGFAKKHLGENVEYVLRDANGNVKKLFQPWSFIAKLIKAGKISPNHPKIFPIFGYWANSLRMANYTTNVGQAAVAAQISGAATFPVFQYIGVGLGTAAGSSADTALVSEILDSGLARGTATISRVTTDVTNDTAQAVLSFTVTGTKAVAESGLFNHIGTATGTMLARQTFSAINVVNGDTLQITWKIDID